MHGTVNLKKKVLYNCLSSEMLESLENVTTDFTLLAILGDL